MYLVIGIMFLSVSIFIAVYYVFNILVSLKIAKKTYSVKSSGEGYFFLENIFKIADTLSVYFFKIKIKYIDDYIKKTNDILKILDEPYSKFNGKRLLMLQFFFAFTGVFLGFIAAGKDITVIFFSGILFFFLPYIKIIEMHKKKRASVIKQLPNVSDLLAVMISAGVDFNNALLKIAGISEGDFAKEIQTVNSKISMGVNTKQALSEMAEKYEMSQLNLFVRTINSALESGIGMAESINKLSEQLKLENAAAAEKKAQEAPVKMLIPMILLMFPTIFILLFAPIIISFMANGGL